MQAKPIIESFRTDSSSILDFLLRSDPEYIPEKLNETLDEIFPPDHWKTYYDSTNYNQESTYANLYNTEMGKPFHDFLKARSVGVDEYTQILGTIQYNAIRTQLVSIFPERNGTKGWKLAILGFPSLRLVVVGLEHHYGDSRSQAQLGLASQRMREVAVEYLPAEFPMLEEFPAARQVDWDERGLMVEPVLSIGDLDISEFENGAGAKIRFVRNTSAKKEIATLIFRRALNGDQIRAVRQIEGADSEMSEFDIALAACRQMARELGRRRN